MKVINSSSGGEKEEFEVMPGSEMPGQGGNGLQRGNSLQGGNALQGGSGLQGGRAEGLADLLSLIARLGTQVMYLYLYLYSYLYLYLNLYLIFSSILYFYFNLYLYFLYFWYLYLHLYNNRVKSSRKMPFAFSSTPRLWLSSTRYLGVMQQKQNAKDFTF